MAEAAAAESVDESTMTEEESYDNVPYESYTYPATHPDRLAVLGSLFGLKPAAMDKARVLELGCAGGGNLLPLAMSYPKGHYFGIDLSGKQIEEANAHKAALGLENIEFKQRDIAKLEQDIGEFDYIICHGVFSWVPEFVRDAIFEVCRRHLSPHGMAVISFNVLPGWNMVRSLREMMLFHANRFEQPADKIREARALLNFLHNNVRDSNKTYKDTIERELNLLKKTNDSYIFHEHLEAENNQFYLHQFVDMARGHGLDYLGDSNLTTMYLGNFPEDARKQLSAITDIVQQEQYMDFINNRRFRYAVLARGERSGDIKRKLTGEQIFDYWVEANFKINDEAKDVTPDRVPFIGTGNNQTFTVSKGVLSALLEDLAKAGAPVKLKALCNKTAKRLGKNTQAEQIEAEVAKNGMLLVLQGFLSLHAEQFKFADKVSKKPQAYDLALYQAGLPNVMKVCNLKRGTITLDIFSKRLLTLCDGEHDKAAMLQTAKGWVESGDITLRQNDEPVTDPAKVEALLEAQIDGTLQKFQKLALFKA